MPLMKYNPSFLPDQALIDSFCVRLVEFESLLETLRETKGGSNVHRLVIGPRGSGKTTLVLRVAAEVRRDLGLSAMFFPLVLPEEHYEVSTCGEFWLECVSRLAASAPPERNGIDLRLTHEELRGLASDRELEDRCLATLLDFARRADKRLLVIVENLNTLFEETSDPDVGWRLRKVLQTEPRIMLLATATCRFDEIDHPEHALYNFFESLALSGLRTNECAALWERVSGKRTAGREIRSIEILTGGSPRLIAIIAQFGGGLSFERLLHELMQLVDDHTEYFKSHIEALPSQERRVYLALAEIWKPATASEVAKHARLQSSHCSAHLKRLASRGVVAEAGGTPRRKEYYVTERLYNIYYLVRKRGGPAALVEALIRFMASFYSVSELIGGWVGIVTESEESSSGKNPLVADAIARLIEILPGHRAELLGRLPETFTKAVGETTLWKYKGPVSEAAQPASPDLAMTPELAALVQKIDKSNFASDNSRLAEVCDEIFARSGANPRPGIRMALAGAWLNRGVLLASEHRMEEALQCFRWAEEYSANDIQHGMALSNQGLALASVSRPEEAVQVFDEICARFLRRDSPELVGFVAGAFFNGGVAYRELGRTEEALRVWDQGIGLLERHPTDVTVDCAFKSCLNKAGTLSDLERYGDALECYERATALFESSEYLRNNHAYAARLLMNKASALIHVDRFEHALEASERSLNELERAIQAPGTQELRAGALSTMGSALERLDRDEEALKTYSEIIDRYSESANPAVVGRVVEAIINKSQVLSRADRLHDALRVYDAIEKWLQTAAPDKLAKDLEIAILNRAAIAIKVEAPGQAIEIANRVIDHGWSDSAKNRARAFWIRAEARYGTGDISGCLSDIDDALVLLPDSAAPLDLAINQLILFGARLGVDQVLASIERSPSADLLLPLSTALAQDVGRNPRVSKEVAEVARDLRDDIANVRASLAKAEPVASEAS